MTAVQAPVSSRSTVLTVSAVVQETADACSLVFDVPQDRRADFTYKPGQFLTLRIPSEVTGSVARCYSLASSPHADEPLKVTVKRTADGYGSNWLCDNITAGQSIEVLPPAGVFTPVDLTEKLVLFAGGSGITPVMSILKSALHSGNRNVVVIYGNRDEKSVIFAEELRELAARHSDALTVVHWLESVQGLPSPQQLATLISSFADHRAYMCGPGPFMDTVRNSLLLAGVPKDRIHAEVFTSLSGDPFADVPLVEIDESDADATSATVQLDGEEHELVCRAAPLWWTSCCPRAWTCRIRAVRASADRARAPSSKERWTPRPPRFSTRRTSPTVTSSRARPGRRARTCASTSESPTTRSSPDAVRHPGTIRMWWISD